MGHEEVNQTTPFANPFDAAIIGKASSLVIKREERVRESGNVGQDGIWYRRGRVEWYF
jgi:hypothetical protein